MGAFGNAFGNSSGNPKVSLLSLVDQMAFWSGDFNFNTNKWLDQSGNGNDFSIQNSYGIYFNGATVSSFASTKTLTSFNLTDGFFIEWISKIDSATNPYICGGNGTTTNSINVTNVNVRITTNQSFLIFNVGMLGGAYETWNHYKLEVIGTNMKCTNYTTGVTHTLPLGTLTDFKFNRIGGRSTNTANMTGTMGYLNLNNVHEYTFSEGLWTYSSMYSVIDRRGGNHAANYQPLMSYVLTNPYHGNLKNGFSFWEDGLGNKFRCPYGADGNPLNLISGTDIKNTYVKTEDCPAGSWHNNAETSIKAPAGLLSYDVSNYLFDESNQPKELLFENISENVGNKIFANKSNLNKCFDLIVFNDIQT